MTDSTTTVDVPGYKAGAWVLDPSHSEVTFSLRHMMISKVRGEFGLKSATIEAPEVAVALAGPAQPRGGDARGGVEKLGVEQLRAFHRRTYAGSNLCLVVAGNITRADAVKWAKPWLDRKGRASKKRELSGPGPRKPKVHVAAGAVSEACVRIGLRGPSLLELDDVVALELTCHALGEGEGSRDLADWRTAHERFWTSPEFTGPFTARGRQAPAVDDDSPSCRDARLSLMTRLRRFSRGPTWGTPAFVRVSLVRCVAA